VLAVAVPSVISYLVGRSEAVPGLAEAPTTAQSAAATVEPAVEPATSAPVPEAQEMPAASTAPSPSPALSASVREEKDQQFGKLESESGMHPKGASTPRAPSTSAPKAEDRHGSVAPVPSGARTPKPDAAPAQTPPAPPSPSSTLRKPIAGPPKY
jgi:hypothetical protein